MDNTKEEKPKKKRARKRVPAYRTKGNINCSEQWLADKTNGEWKGYGTGPNLNNTIVT